MITPRCLFWSLVALAAAVVMWYAIYRIIAAAPFILVAAGALVGLLLALDKLARR